jgi:hypothetical protein
MSIHRFREIRSPLLRRVAVYYERRGLDWAYVGSGDETRDGQEFLVVDNGVEMFPESEEVTRCFCYLTVYRIDFPGKVELFYGWSGDGNYIYLPEHDEDRVMANLRWCLRYIGY